MNKATNRSENIHFKLFYLQMEYNEAMNLILSECNWLCQLKLNQIINWLRIFTLMYSLHRKNSNQLKYKGECAIRVRSRQM